MNVRDLIPGSKVDIRAVQSIKREGYSDSEGSHYVSSIFDVLADETIELTMPMRGGRIVLIPMGIRYELVFTTATGLKRADAEIIGRVRRENFYILHARLTTPLDKFQRREYYRLNTMMPLTFVELDERAGEITKMSEIRELMITDEEHPPRSGHGTIMDISGGGIRFLTDEDMTGSEYLLLHFMIESGGKERGINLIGQIVGEAELPEGDRRHSYRVKLLYKDSGCQESIIRFIFETERRIRKKQMGG